MLVSGYVRVEGTALAALVQASPSNFSYLSSEDAAHSPKAADLDSEDLTRHARVGDDGTHLPSLCCKAGLRVEIPAVLPAWKHFDR